MGSLPSPRLTVSALAALIALAGAPRAAVSGTTLVSEDLSANAAGSAGLNRNPGSTLDFSPDGRFVLFTSTATDLVSGVTDTNGGSDVFLADLQQQTIAIVSVNSAGAALGTVGNAALGGFVFSPDSKRLVFRTQSTGLVAGLADTNSAPDWFVRDLLAGTTSCVTISSAGTSTGNLTSFTNEPPVFSPDGRYLAFHSLAGDLVAGVTDSSGRDLFLRDLEEEATIIVSVATSGNAAGQGSEDPARFSPDGKHLAFISGSTQLVAGVTDTNGASDLFVRDLEAGNTSLVSHTAAGAAAGFSSSYAWLPDSDAIVFTAYATGMVAGVVDTNNGDDLFAWNRQSTAVSIVSGNPAGTSAGDKVSRLLALSHDGRYVAFGSASTNLAPESAGGDTKDDLYVRDLELTTTSYVAYNASGSVVFPPPRFLPDGLHLLFESQDANVVSGITDTNGNRDLFLNNLLTGDSEVVTARFDGTATASSASTSIDDVVVSPNGRYVSFVSDASDLVPGFTSASTRDLYVRDLQTGTNFLVSAGLDGNGAGHDQGATRDAEFSVDSRFLVFSSRSLLASQVTTAFNQNFASNLFAFDLVAGEQNLLTVNAAGTMPANGGFQGPFEGGVESFSFIVNPGGDSVLFIATFTDMVSGVTDTAGTSDLFLADLPLPPSQCGDPVPDGSITSDAPALVKASDSLYVLRAAVGAASCEPCVCDVNSSGGVSAGDALLTLRFAVGQGVVLLCPACGGVSGTPSAAGR